MIVCADVIGPNGTYPDASKHNTTADREIGDHICVLNRIHVQPVLRTIH
jgi:hypothetical protein